VNPIALPVDPSATFVVTKLLFVALAVIWAYRISKGRAGRESVLVLLAFLLLGWIASNVPLERIYGLEIPSDRGRNLAWCLSVAAGNSPMSTGIVGHVALEPFWASLVATLSLFDPARALAIYPFLSLLVVAVLALSLYRHFRSEELLGGEETSEALALRGLLVAAFATLFVTAPLDFIGPYRGYWARAFLLKPNHALGLGLVPWLLARVARPGWKSAVHAGLLAGLLAWVFPVHWAFVGFALAIYLALVAAKRLLPLRAEAGRVATVVLISSLFVAPAIYVLLVYYPSALTLARGTYPEAPMRSDWGDIMPVGVSLFFQVTLEQGLVFYLGCAGAFFWLRERTRAALLWASLFLGAYVLWAVNYVLYRTARAREADEFYNFLLFILSVAAGYGAFRALQVLHRAVLSLGRKIEFRSLVAASLLLLIPVGFPYWWEPPRMDGHFRQALEPLPPTVRELTDWIRVETGGRDVFVVSGEIFGWIPALTGRQVKVATGDVGREVLRVAEADVARPEEALGASYVVRDGALSEELALSEHSFPRWPVVFENRHFRVHRLASPE
jgi:hypothetical protein